MEKKKTDLDRFIDEVQKEINEEERDIYSEKVIEEANNPKNVGRMTDCDAAGILDGSCGDTIEIYMKIKNNKIIDTSFMTNGCGATIACGSMLTTMVKGKEIDKVMNITKDDLINALDGLPEENLHCAALAVGSLRKAIMNYRKKRDLGLVAR
jgi:nitrogen fixation NifU-like protein